MATSHMTDTYGASDSGEVTDRAPDAARTTAEIDHDELLARVKKWFQDDGPHSRAFHTEAKKAFSFRSGDQWPKEDREALEGQKRAPLTFNRIDPVIDAVVGAEITNRQEVRYIPRKIQQPDTSINDDVLTEAARWFRDECDAEHEESHGFADAATCGMGWTETRLDYEETPEGEPDIKRVDPMEMYWDHAARQANLTDARRVYRIRRKVPIEECISRWPEYEDDPSSYDATWAASDDDEEQPHDNPKPRYTRDQQANGGVEDDATHNEEVTLVQVQWWERETYYRGVIQPMMADPMMGPQPPQQTEFSEDEHIAMMGRAPKMGMQYRGVRMTRKCYYEAFIGKEVLEADKLVAPSGQPVTSFKFVPITGKLDRNKGIFYGLVRGMEGPQLFANKWLSTAVEIMARNAKGGLLFEEGAVADIAEFEATYAIPGSNNALKDGAIAGQKIMPKPVGNFPTDFMQMTQFAISSIRDVTGVNAEILGMADADQAASLEYQRRQSATVILAPLFDSLRRYRRIQGRILLHLITEYLSDGRLVRIVGREKEQYVPLIRDPSVSKYDVIVDDAPSSPSQKELVWGSLVQMMPFIQNMQLPPNVILPLLDYSPIPASVVMKIKQGAAEAQQNAKPQPSPVELATMQMQLDIQKEQQTNQIKLKGKQDEQQFKMAELAAELDQKKQLADIELWKEEQKAALQQQKVHNDMALDAAQTHHEIAAHALKTEAKTHFDIKAGAAKADAKAAMAPKPTASKSTAGKSKDLHDSIGMLVEVMSKPRKRTLVRDRQGRPSHVIDEVAG